MLSTPVSHQVAPRAEQHAGVTSIHQGDPDRTAGCLQHAPNLRWEEHKYIYTRYQMVIFNRQKIHTQPLDADIKKNTRFIIKHVIS